MVGGLQRTMRGCAPARGESTAWSSRSRRGVVAGWAVADGAVISAGSCEVAGAWARAAPQARSPRTRAVQQNGSFLGMGFSFMGWGFGRGGAPQPVLLLSIG